MRLSFALVTASEAAVLTQPYELATLIGDVHPMSFTVRRRPLHRPRLHVLTITHHGSVATAPKEKQPKEE